MRTITFYSTTTCPSCRMMKPWVNDLHLNVEYVTINIDSPEIAEFNIMSVPTIIVWEDGVEIARLVGSHSKASLISFFNNTL